LKKQRSDPGQLVDHLITNNGDEHTMGALRLATTTFLRHYTQVPHKSQQVTTETFVCSESWFNSTTNPDTSQAPATQYSSMEDLINEILQYDSKSTHPVIATICQILKINLTLTLPSAILAEALGFYGDCLAQA
jgi:hypothetical protein